MSILKDTRTSELNIELRSEAQIRLKKSKILLGSYIKQSAAKIQHRLLCRFHTCGVRFAGRCRISSFATILKVRRHS
jgi:hypothetical protein